ncbi:tetratricopeptide repeat protein [Sporomusa acidovorans]|uniref:Cell division coordinator CpoB n=1 Tax=Sporomusa acidovorans (strain ATCC 49682 / DSM 3132 / Mol) TaxID=1123286 RepID=A0ABZ3IY68_SPOA4|nr:tetratricopeptide repeat protein [Sporomusa acidovorans]OZC17640.1 lipoprotein NlpI precursor [Sporomusa acidovorans DSM 3132]SDE10423.1 TPR repeat-containing protein [Sporomusa acidovorans]
MKRLVVLVLFVLVTANLSLGFAAGKKAEAEINQERIAACTRSIAADPHAVTAYIERGKAYEEDKQFTLAIADYAQAIQLDPQNIQAYAVRGRVYSETKQYDAAAADYTKIIEMAPGNIDAHFRRGICYYYLGQYELGINDLDQVIVVQPKHAGAYLVKGVCYQKLDRPDEAIQAYKSLLANVPVEKQTREAITVAKNMLKKLGVEP